MAGWLGRIGSLLGLGGTDAGAAPPGGGLLAPRPPAFARDQIRHDAWAMPYRGPLDLDPHGGETPHMRETYRALYQREGVVAAAVDGKVEGIATADVTIEPFDRHDPASRDVAEFLSWSVDQSDGGWDTITTDTLLPAFLDGWAALEVTLHPARHPRFGWVWALRHCRSLDTRFLRLQLDVHRNVTAVVSLVRGLEAFDPAKVLLFTHRRVYHNPFGTSDMRAVYRDACLIEDAYKLWYLALKMYGEPYLKGKVRNPAHRRQLEEALAALRAGGYLVTPDTDDVEILSLAGAVNFPAFEAKVRNLRENIFLAVRGSYLPFVEGVGGADAHGDTKVGKGNADAKEALLAKAVARLYTRQLAPLLLAPNFGPDVVHQLPKVRLGGIDWEAVEKVTRAVGEIKDKFPGRVSISQSWLGPTLGIPPATGPDDEANVAPPEGGPGGGPGGGGGGPGGGGMPSPSGIAGGATPPGSQADGPATLPGADRTFSDGQPPRPGLVPKSGDPQHPEHWVLPDNTGSGVPPARPAEPDAATGGQGRAASPPPPPPSAPPPSPPPPASSANQQIKDPSEFTPEERAKWALVGWKDTVDFDTVLDARPFLRDYVDPLALVHVMRETGLAEPEARAAIGALRGTRLEASDPNHPIAHLIRGDTDGQAVVEQFRASLRGDPVSRWEAEQAEFDRQIEQFNDQTQAATSRREKSRINAERKKVWDQKEGHKAAKPPGSDDRVVRAREAFVRAVGPGKNVSVATGDLPAGVTVPNAVALAASDDDRGIREAGEAGGEFVRQVLSNCHLQLHLARSTDVSGPYPRAFCQTIQGGAPNASCVALVNRNRSVAVHEAAHAITQHKPGVDALTKQFLNYRCGGEKPENLRTRFGDTYKPDETGRKDEFGRVWGDEAQAYYVGKVYADNNEFLSMALEEVYKNPGRVAEADPELFQFVVHVLRR